MEDRRAQAREQGTAVDQDQVDTRGAAGPACRSRRGSPENRAAARRPSASARSPDGRRERRSGRRTAPGRSRPRHRGPLAGRRPRCRADHRAGQVGIDHEGAQRVSCQRARQGQHQRRPSLGAMTTGEQQDLDTLPLLAQSSRSRAIFSKRVRPILARASGRAQATAARPTDPGASWG